MKREIVAEPEIDAFAQEHVDDNNDNPNSMAKRHSAKTRTSTETAGLTDHLYNDHGNACRLIAMYGEDLRYCHAFKKWLVWDGKRWAVDDTDQARRLAKQAMLEFLRQAIDKGAGEKAEKFARSSLDVRRITSLLSMAESEIFVRPAATRQILTC